MQATLFRSFVAVTVGLPLLAQAPKAPLPTAEALLPASTYAAARFGGLAACRDATAALPMAPAVQMFLQKIPGELRQEMFEAKLDEAASEVQAQLQQVGLRPADVRGFLQRPMTLAVGRLSIEGMGPSVALVVEVGDQKEAVNRVVQWASRFLAKQANGGETGSIEVGGHKFHSLALSEAPPLYAGAIGGNYVVTNSRGYLRDMIDVAAGKQASLHGTTRLVQLNAMLPAPALAAWFLNTDRVLSAFAPHMPYEAEDWAQALGLGSVDAIWAGMTSTDAGGADVFHLGLGGSERGLLKALVAAPADLEFARSCSANTVAFAAGSFDVSAVVDAFHRFTALLPAPMRKEMLREMEQEMGRELRGIGSSPQELHRMLGAFGTQIGIALALEKGAVPKPELLVRIAVRDADTVLSLMQQIEAMVVQETGLEWKTRKADGHEVRFCNLPLPDMNLQLSPCYVLTKDALWFGSDAAALVRSLRQEEGECLAAQPDFQAMAKQGKGASGLMFLRLSRVAEIGWRTVETMAYPQLDAHKDEVGFGSEALPDSETMAKALGTSSWFYRVDDSGITVESHGTFTYGSVLAVVGAGIDEVLSRAGGKVY